MLGTVENTDQYTSSSMLGRGDINGQNIYSSMLGTLDNTDLYKASFMLGTVDKSGM